MKLAIQSLVHVDDPLFKSLLKEAPYRIAEKFGGSVIYINQRQIEIRQNFLLAYIYMTIPCQTTKFKIVNILVIAISGSTAKFNSRQYFRL